MSCITVLPQHVCYGTLHGWRAGGGSLVSCEKVMSTFTPHTVTEPLRGNGACALWSAELGSAGSRPSNLSCSAECCRSKDCRQQEMWLWRSSLSCSTTGTEFHSYEKVEEGKLRRLRKCYCNPHFFPININVPLQFVVTSKSVMSNKPKCAYHWRGSQWGKKVN